jgi:MSHA biogenesis protein MshN
MSLINQMLQDLEKRRASAAERGAVPNQVRVLPTTEKTRLGAWIAMGGIALTALAGWQYWLAQQRVAMSSPPLAAQAQGAEPDAAPGVKYLAEGPATLLALDLAVLPAPKAVLAGRPPVAPLAGAAPSTAASTEAPVADPKLKPPLAMAAVIGMEAAAAPVASAAKVVPPAGDAKAASASAVSAVSIIAPVPPVPPVAPKPRSADAGGEPRVQLAATGAQIDKRMQTLTPAQMAENEYREAANFLGQGRLVEAQDSFRQALQHNPLHAGARQGLFGLLVDAKRTPEAEQLLKDGLKLNANQPGLAMALARLQLDRADANAAIETLQASAASAQNSPDYLAFFAGLLQRQSRHREAVEQYLAALRLAPNSGVWLMGLGISLQALGRNTDAQDAFRRARASNTLNPDLQAFVDQRLRQLQ